MFSGKSADAPAKSSSPLVSWLRSVVDSRTIDSAIRPLMCIEGQKSPSSHRASTLNKPTPPTWLCHSPRNRHSRRTKARSPFASHSQTTSAFHPIALIARRFSASRSTFLASFERQYPMFDCGWWLSEQRRLGCCCQKQPCTKMTFRRVLNTKSGLPGKSGAWRRYL